MSNAIRDKKAHKAEGSLDRVGWSKRPLWMRATLVGLAVLILLVICGEVVYRLVKSRSATDLVLVRLLTDEVEDLNELRSAFPELETLRSSSNPLVLVLPNERRRDLLSYLEETKWGGQLEVGQVREKFMAPLATLGDQQLSAEMIDFRRRLESDPLIAGVTFAKAKGRSLSGLFEPKLVGAEQRLAMPIAATEVVTATLDRTARVGPRGAINEWRGASPTALVERGTWPSRISVSEFDGNAYAFIEHEQMVYEIRPLVGDGYAIVRANWENDPGSATSYAEADASEGTTEELETDGAGVIGARSRVPDVFSRRRRTFPLPTALAVALPALPAGAAEPKTTGDPVRIGLVVAYTSDAVAEHEDDYIPAMVSRAVGDAQDALRSSVDPKIELDLECVQRFEQASKQDLKTDLDLIAADGDGYLDEVHELRQRNNGDLVVLLTGQTGLGGARCGLAKRIFAERKEDGFAVVRKDCAKLLDGFIHEVGHLLGAAHDDHQNEKTLYRPYGRGAVFGTKDRPFRTIMTSARSCGNCERVELWSSLNTFDGLVTGSEEANNLRVIAETARSIAALMPEGPEGGKTCVQ